MPQYAVLIYTSDSAHALDATRDDLAEPDAHGDEADSSGRCNTVCFEHTKRAPLLACRLGGAIFVVLVSTP